MSENRSLETVGDNQRYVLASAVILFGIFGALAVFMDSWKALGIGCILFLSTLVAAIILPPKRQPSTLTLEEPLPNGEPWKPHSTRPPDYGLHKGTG